MAARTQDAGPESSQDAAQDRARGPDAAVFRDAAPDASPGPQILPRAADAAPDTRSRAGPRTPDPGPRTPDPRNY